MKDVLFSNESTMSRLHLDEKDKSSCRLLATRTTLNKENSLQHQQMKNGTCIDLEDNMRVQQRMNQSSSVVVVLL